MRRELPAKLYFRIDEQMEDRELLRNALETTARALPLPKPKPAAKRAAKGASAKATGRTKRVP